MGKSLQLLHGVNTRIHVRSRKAINTRCLPPSNAPVKLVTPADKDELDAKSTSRMMMNLIGYVEGVDWRICHALLTCP